MFCCNDATKPSATKTFTSRALDWTGRLTRTDKAAKNTLRFTRQNAAVFLEYFGNLVQGRLCPTHYVEFSNSFSSHFQNSLKINFLFFSFLQIEWVALVTFLPPSLRTSVMISNGLVLVCRCLKSWKR